MPLTFTPTPPELSHAATLRRRLHQHPELAFAEFDTAALIRAELTRLAIPFSPGPADAPTATIAVIGDPARPCLALRADIDALPILEATGLPHASTRPGKMHACGHDGHTANLLATAAALTRLAPSLPVCVKLIFQPAEEGGGGADRLVRAGVLNGTAPFGPKVAAIFGLHGWPGLPVGTVSTRPGPIMASTDTLRVIVRGRGCHGAFPHLGADPLLAAAETVMSLQAFVSRELDPVDAAVVTVGILHAGTATNIIPETARLEATVRTLTDATRKQARDALIRRCTGIAHAHACTAEITYDQGYPATHNHPDMAALVERVARATLGPANYFPSPAPVMGGEDFAYYTQEVPGAFFFIGVRPESATEYPPLHSDRFDFQDDALATGTQVFLALTQAFAQSHT